MKTIVLILAMVFFCSCTERPRTPVEAYRVFYEAVREEDWDTVEDLLSPASLDVFRRVGERLSSMVEYEGNPLDFFFMQVKGIRITPLRNVEVAERKEGTAMLKIVAGPCKEGKKCSRTTVKMVLQGGCWLLEPKIPALLARSASVSPRGGKNE